MTGLMALATADRPREFVAQYVRTLLWAETDGEQPLDSAGYTAQDLSPEAMEQIRMECARFLELAGERIFEVNLAAAAHDFLLTRNGHGAGFWDGDWPINGDFLTALAHAFGEAEVYVGDDSQIYVTPTRDPVEIGLVSAPEVA